MSFPTARPFFPYSEPADLRDDRTDHTQARLLRIFFIAADRMDGALDPAVGASPEWPGRVTWADELDDVEDLAPLSQELTLAPGRLPRRRWMTVFEDDASPRPGVADLFFTPAEEQIGLLPPPIVVNRDERIGIPIELILLTTPLVAAILLARNRTQRRPASPPASPYR